MLYHVLLLRHINHGIWLDVHKQNRVPQDVSITVLYSIHQCFRFPKLTCPLSSVVCGACAWCLWSRPTGRVTAWLPVYRLPLHGGAMREFANAGPHCQIYYNSTFDGGQRLKCQGCVFYHYISQYITWCLTGDLKAQCQSDTHSDNFLARMKM